MDLLSDWSLMLDLVQLRGTISVEN